VRQPQQEAATIPVVTIRVIRVKEYYVYIMANEARTLYMGVTGNLEGRVYQHKNKLVKGFTSKYGLHKLVYCASTNDVREAIAEEKRIKGWSRAKKVALIEEMNPGWEDLSATWYSNNKQPGKDSDSSLRSE
jgi:putative endonuclease